MFVQIKILSYIRKCFCQNERGIPLYLSLNLFLNFFITPGYSNATFLISDSTVKLKSTACASVEHVIVHHVGKLHRKYTAALSQNTEN